MTRLVRRFFAIACICAAAAIVAAAPALAQTQRQLSWCFKGAGFSAALRIQGCTATIQSGRQSDQNLASAFYNRGIAYAEKGQNDLAIADFDQVLQRDPGSIYALNNRGAAYARKGDFDRAIEDFDQAIGLNSRHAITFNNRGTAFAKKGQYERAIADFDEALRLDPRDRSALKNRQLAKQLHDGPARAKAAVAETSRKASAEAQPARASRDVERAESRAAAQPRPARQLQDDPPRSESRAARASKARVPARVKASYNPQRSAARVRRAQPQSGLLRFFRQAQIKIRNAFRMASPRRTF